MTSTKMSPPREVVVYEQLARYIRIQYPNVLYKFNHEDARKRGLRLQFLIKLLSSGRSWPDLQIAEPRKGYAGLFIEIKRDGTRIKKRNGEWASEHLEAQHEMCKQLEARGYCAAIAVGFDAAKKVIDEYLTGGRDGAESDAF